MTMLTAWGERSGTSVSPPWVFGVSRTTVSCKYQSCLMRNLSQDHFWQSSPAVGSRDANKAVQWLRIAVGRCFPQSKLAKRGVGGRTNSYQYHTKPKKPGGATKPATIHSSYGVLPCSYGPNSLSVVVWGPGRGQGILPGPVKAGPSPEIPTTAVGFAAGMWGGQRHYYAEYVHPRN